MLNWRRVALDAFARWVPLAVLGTLVIGLIYAAEQHDLRSGANDPQVQLAEDASARLSAGAGYSEVLLPGRVDIAHSLAPFVIVFDQRGLALASSAVLDGQTPVPPLGVFDSARTRGRDMLTWQPRAGVRIAAVILPFQGGFVLSGRSLRLVEQRESDLEGILAVGWLLTLVAAGVSVLIVGVVRSALAKRSPAGVHRKLKATRG